MKMLAMGFQHTIAGLISMNETVRNAYTLANRIEMERTLTKAKQLVPVDTGNLKNSGFLHMEPRRDGVGIEIGFRADYSLKVHEDLAAFHENGQAKYLEEAMTEKLDGWDERVADSVLTQLETTARTGRPFTQKLGNIAGNGGGRKSGFNQEKKAQEAASGGPPKGGGRSGTSRDSRGRYLNGSGAKKK